MPLIKSAIKKMRRDQSRQNENLGQRTQLKSILSKAVKTKDAQTITQAISLLDRAAKKHLIHANKASRKKSTLMKLLSNKTSQSKAKVETSSNSRPKTKKTVGRKTKK